MTEDTAYSWRDGMPTKPDVDLIIKTWPDLKVGDRVTYAEIADVIGVAYGTRRFQTITQAWRKRMQDANLVIECEDKTAFYVANCDQISAGTYSDLDSARRKLRNRRRKLSAAKPETDEQRGVVAHQGLLLHQYEKQLQKAKTKLLPNTATKSQPLPLPNDTTWRLNDE